MEYDLEKAKDQEKRCLMANYSRLPVLFTHGHADSYAHAQPHLDGDADLDADGDQHGYADGHADPDADPGGCAHLGFGGTG